MLDTVVLTLDQRHFEVLQPERVSPSAKGLLVPPYYPLGSRGNFACVQKSVLIDELIRKEKVELHFYRKGMIIGKGASSTDILRWDFSVMGAKSYVLNLSENVRRSLEYKRRNGEWGGKAPLGYLNQRDANNKSTLIHDPERAFLVRMLFEEYAKGCLSISGDLVRMAREWGLRNKTRKGGVLSASQIQHLLMNPFYYGEMRIKGTLYPHSYPRSSAKSCSTSANRFGLVVRARP
jgi:hypothetical protein